MRKQLVHLLTFVILAVAGGSVYGSPASRFDLDVLVVGEARPEYRSGSTVYVEALRGQEYELRMTNPTPYRVAVALSVDGLNTIDARRTDARNAAKWVLAPYESTVISGWQVDRTFARHFFFTTEEASYAATLGQTDNLGVIEAVVYRERIPRATYARPEARSGVAPESAGVDRESKRQASGDVAAPKPEQSLAEDYAATGMGDRTVHEVRRVHFDLAPQPIAKVRIRYEYRPQLVELGILPDLLSPLERRERASGFCPQP